MLQSGTWEEFSSRICAQLKPMLPPPANHKLTELKTDVEGGNASVEPRTDVKKRLKTFALETFQNLPDSEKGTDAETPGLVLLNWLDMPDIAQIMMRYA